MRSSGIRALVMSAAMWAAATDGAYSGMPAFGFSFDVAPDDASGTAFDGWVRAVGRPVNLGGASEAFGVEGASLSCRGETAHLDCQITASGTSSVQAWRPALREGALLSEGARRCGTVGAGCGATTYRLDGAYLICFTANDSGRRTCEIERMPNAEKPECR